MDIKKKSRSELQNYFKKKAIPTQENFTDLIDGMLNQQDDGIKKLPKYPLAIQAPADGDSGRENELLHLYKQFGDTLPDWTIGLRPGTGKSHLNIADGTGKNAFFIEQGTCNIGLGTTTPTHALHVVGSVRIDGVMKMPAPTWTPITPVTQTVATTTWLVDPLVQAPASYKDPRGIVRFRGILRSGTANTAANVVIAKLDPGSAPAATVRLAVPSTLVALGAMAYVAVDFLTNGDIKVTEAIALGRYLVLDGLSFEAAT